MPLTLQELRAACELSEKATAAVVQAFIKEMEAGLKGEPSRLKMLNSFCERLPTGSEKGTYFAVDLGGTNFRVVRVTIADGVVQSNEATSVRIPPELMKSTTQELFAFIADSVAAFVQERQPPGESEAPLRLGFTFSFPCEQSALHAGKLICWTKGFDCTDGPGLDVCELLDGELRRRGCRVRVAALVNDTVGTLAAARFKDPDAAVGVILGTGTNACYVERRCEGTKVASESGEMVINIEWGNFAEALPVLDADRRIDARSPNPSEQVLEKLMAGMYLGAIVAELLVDLDEGAGGPVLPREVRDAIKAEKVTDSILTTANVSYIDCAECEGLERAREVAAAAFKSLPPLSDAALALLKEVCRLVGLRSAKLAAAGVAAVLQKMQLTAGRVVVAVDGGLYENYTRYAETMKAELSRLVGPAVQAELVLAKDGSGLGSALLVASLKE